MDWMDIVFFHSSFFSFLIFNSRYWTSNSSFFKVSSSIFLLGLEQLVRPLLNGSIHEDGDGGGGDSGSRMWGTVSGGPSIILIPTGSSPISPPNWMIEVSKPPGIPDRQVLFSPTTFETAMAIVLSVFWGGPPPKMCSSSVIRYLWFRFRENVVPFLLNLCSGSTGPNTHGSQWNCNVSPHPAFHFWSQRWS